MASALCDILYSTARNPAFVSDVGVAWWSATLLTHGAAATALALLASLTQHPWAAAWWFATGTMFAAVSYRRFVVATALLTSLSHIVAYAIAAAAFGWCVHRLLRRASMDPAAAGVLLLALQAGLLALALRWRSTGLPLTAFLQSPGTLVLLAAIPLGTALLLLSIRRSVRATFFVVVGGFVMGILLMTAPRHMPGGASDGTKPSPDLPHVFVLSFDALRKDALERLCEPTASAALRSICEGAVRFENVIADGLRTYPILAANTRGSGGRDCAQSVPAAFAAQGYTTSLHVGRRDAQVDGSKCYGYFRAGFGRTLAFDLSLMAATKALWDRLAGRAPELRAKYVPSPHVLDRAFEHIRRTRRPSFSYVHLMDLHFPYVPSSKQDDADFTSRMSELLRRCYIHNCSRDHARELYVQFAREAYEEALFKDVRAAVVRVHRQLRAMNRPFVLLVTADHGELLGEHGGFGHINGFVPELLNIPAWALSPSSPQRRRCDLIKSSHLLRMLASEAPSGRVDGRTLPTLDTVRIQARLGSARVHKRGSIDFEIAPQMKSVAHLNFNVHDQLSGTVAFSPSSCPHQ